MIEEVGKKARSEAGARSGNRMMKKQANDMLKGGMREAHTGIGGGGIRRRRRGRRDGVRRRR